MDSDTPRTDAETYYIDDSGFERRDDKFPDFQTHVSATFARELERELAQARQEIVDLKCELVDAKASADCWADQCSQRVEDWDKMRKWAEAAEEDAERWRMLPAFLRKHQINYVLLLDDIDAALKEQK